MAKDKGAVKVIEPVTLDTPIKRGDTEITQVYVKKPNSGSLRGTSLTDLMGMDVVGLMKVLPRITNPSLTEAEIQNMDPADLVQLGSELVGFLLPKSALPGYQED